MIDYLCLLFVGSGRGRNLSEEAEGNAKNFSEIWPCNICNSSQRCALCCNGHICMQFCLRTAPVREDTARDTWVKPAAFQNVSPAVGDPKG